MEAQVEISNFNALPKWKQQFKSFSIKERAVCIKRKKKKLGVIALTELPTLELE